MSRLRARPLPQSLVVVGMIICWMLVFATTIHAQTVKSVSGYVVNSKNEPSFGNAIIVSPKDSSLIAGTSFLQGRFELAGLNVTRALLKLTSLEFEDFFIPIEYKGESSIDLGEIVVTDAVVELDEVVVVGKAPIMVQKPDGSISLKVANTALETSASAQEILSRSPSVMVDENNEISIFGKGNAVLFVNGMRVDNARLSTISPSTIESIEIITNPGPRYDAEGNVVINILIKSNLDEGSKGVLNNQYSYSDFAGYQNRTNIDWNYKKGKWSLNTSYGLLIGNDRWSKATTRTRNETASFFNSDIALDWFYEHNNFSNYRLGGQYEISESQYISLEYNGAYEDMGGSQVSENEMTDDETGIYQSLLNIGDLDRKNILNVNYSDKLDSLGSQLFIGAQYASYVNDFDNDISESSLVDGVGTHARINNVGEGNIQILSLQLDYTKVLNDKMSLETGGKLSDVSNSSFTNFFDLGDDGSRIRNDVLSNNFEYDEQIAAAYLSLRRQINEHTHYSLGFRTELTHYTLLTSVDVTTVIKDTYINLFPSASFDTQLSNEINLFFSYASRIRRPSYESLNPFVIYQDEFTSIRGNPNLRPSRIHSFEIGGAYLDWGLKMGYTHTLDRITRAAFQLEEGSREYALQSTNFDLEQVFLISLSKNINLKWWRSTNNLSASYNHLTDGSGVFDMRGNTPSFYFYSQNSFDIKNWMRIYLTGWYLSDLQDGIYLRENQSTLNIGLEKSFFGETLKCNLDFNDVFHTVRADGNYRSGLTDIVYGNQFNTNFIRISLFYNFGQLRKSNYQNKKVGEPENGRV